MHVPCQPAPTAPWACKLSWRKAVRAAGPASSGALPACSCPALGSLPISGYVAAPPGSSCHSTRTLRPGAGPWCACAMGSAPEVMPRFLKFVVANEMLDGTDVLGELFREGKGLTYQTRHALGGWPVPSYWHGTQRWVVYLMPADNSIGLKLGTMPPSQPVVEGARPHFYQLALFVLVWLFVTLPTPWEFAPATAPAGSNQRDGLGQAVAAVHARDGGRVDGPRVVAARSAPVSGAAVATATDSLKIGRA